MRGEFKIETFTYYLNYNINLQKYFLTENICFFDIETTGFNRNKDIVYLVGLLIHIDKNYVLKQYLLESIDEENKLLKCLIKNFKSCKYLVTFNGDTFDIPFLNNKYRNHNIDYNIPINKSIDIYKIIRKNKYLFDLKNFKLKSIEQYLGIDRKDMLSGKKCISLFYDFLNNHNEKSKELILQHNYDDLYYLPNILKILDIIKNKKTIILSNIHLYNNDLLKLTIESLEIVNDMMTLNCITTSINTDPIIIFQNNYNIKWDTVTGKLEVQFQIYNSILSTMEKCHYIDTYDFDMKLSTKDTTNFKLPDNIILIQIDKNYIFNNIKDFLYDLIENIILMLK